MQNAHKSSVYYPSFWNAIILTQDERFGIIFSPRSDSALRCGKKDLKGSRVSIMKEKRIRKGYSTKLPREMYLFFCSYSGEGLPSFRKFAQSIGLTLGDITEYRRHREFDRAYRECSEIRRDYLIDNALTRRFDPSFTKFLLCNEYGEEGSSSDAVDLRLEVIEE